MNCDSTTSETTPSNVIETVPTVVKRKDCFPGFVCQNGYCPSGKVECVCDLGWTGPFCDTPCLLDCGQFGQCKSLGANSQSCVCEEGYTGSNCELHPLSNDSTTAITTSSVPVRTPDTTKIPVSTVTAIRHLNYTDPLQHPVKDRTCVPGFVCEHGICHTNDNKSKLLKCVCDDGWIGILCNKKCPLDCGDFGKCGTNENGISYCSCNWTYTGVLCDVLKPQKLQEAKDYSWQWWVIGICITIFVLLVLVLVIVPYVLWRKKELFIMKIIYLFQPFEDSDDKLFDAFISYKSTMVDENFVLNELFPHLETQMNFKLCLHFRDFIPGETISNNIIWAVENSRRTILVLTPDYVESEFCMFEYQKAQHEMLRRKQRIIPIMFQDINDIEHVDKTLQSILDSITYLEWPGEDSPKKIEKFWKRLEFSMPKKKSLVSTSEITRPSDDGVGLKSVTDSSKNRPMSTVEDKGEFIELSIDGVDGIDNLALNTSS
ncbi:uncharacterized protein LOC126819270 isoform X2 [Patella vulgata]|nr:uncharacterized protein LOC126819270 isoform X2 [Patella vulgata]